MDSQARILNFKPQSRLGRRLPAAEPGRPRGALSCSPTPRRPFLVAVPQSDQQEAPQTRVKPFPPFSTPLPPAHDVGSCLRRSLSNRREGVTGFGGGVGWGVWRKRTRAHTHLGRTSVFPQLRGFLRPPGQCVRGRVCVCVARF